MNWKTGVALVAGMVAVSFNSWLAVPAAMWVGWEMGKRRE